MYVVKIPLKPNDYAESVLLKRFRAATCFYNAQVAEAKRRCNRYMRLPSKEQANAIFKEKLQIKEQITALQKKKKTPEEKIELKLLKVQLKEKEAQSKELYEQALLESGFYFGTSTPKGLTDSLARYASTWKTTWIGQHLGSKTRALLAERAYDAVKLMAFPGGRSKKSKKVKFASRRHGIKTIRTITAPTEPIPGTILERRQREIRWIDDRVVWDIQGGKKLYVPAIFDLKDRVIQKFLKDKPPIRKVEIIRNKVGRKITYWAHITVDGQPLIKPKNKLGKGRVGMDLGPNKIAYFSEGGNGKIPFTEFQLHKYDVEIKCLERKIARLKRYHNPENYQPDFRDANGGWKKGKNKTKKRVLKEVAAAKEVGEERVFWKYTGEMNRLADRLADVRRKKAEWLKCKQGEFANLIRSLGDELYIEDDDVKQWQQDKRFSRYVTNNAPSQLVELLTQKFEQTGGIFFKVDTYKTYLSSRCPQCGKIQKKDLGERTHECDCGCVLDRDICSAFLAYCCEENTVPVDRVKELYEEYGTCLRAACTESESVSANFFIEYDEADALTAGSEASSLASGLGTDRPE